MKAASKLITVITVFFTEMVFLNILFTSQHVGTLQLTIHGSALGRVQIF